MTAVTQDRSGSADLDIGHTLRPFRATLTQADLHHMKELIEVGKVTSAIDRTYPLSEAPEAIQYVAEGRARGKVVITVGGAP